jgi:hypothetical protein
MAGVCTGKANLAVALSRVLGIPARVLFVFPTHFIAQFWLPGYGWIRGESTQGIFPNAVQDWTVQWIANIEDENDAGHKGGVIAFWGIDEEVNAVWDVEYDHIYESGRQNNNYAVIDGTSSEIEYLFMKGTELWRLFGQLVNSNISPEHRSIFKGYHELYFESLLVNDIQEAIHQAENAVEEAWRLLYGECNSILGNDQ